METPAVEVVVAVKPLQLPCRETLSETIEVDAVAAIEVSTDAMPAVNAASPATVFPSTADLSQPAAAQVKVKAVIKQPAPKAAASTEQPTPVLSEQDAGQRGGETELLTPQAVSISKAIQGAGSLITVSAEGDDKLEFSFSDECWVEVSDATGSEIYGDLNRAGDTLVVYGKAPFEVLFGKAPAAQMAFNGKRISLDRYTTTDLTAKIKLPR